MSNVAEPDGFFEEDEIGCECGSLEHTTENHLTDTDSPYPVVSGQNLPNHSTSLRGRGKFVQINSQGKSLEMRTKQAVYRLAAHLLAKAETLPGERPDDSFEHIQEALKNK